MGTESIRTFITDALARSPIAKSLHNELREASSAKRKAKAAERAKTLKAAAADVEELAAVEAKAMKACEAPAAALAAAQREVAAARAARQSAAHRLDHERSRLERELAALAPPELGRFEHFLATVLDGLRIIHAPAWPGGRGERVFELVMAARARVEDLRLSGLSDEEILKELQKLRAQLQKACREIGPMPREVNVASRFEVEMAPSPEPEPEAAA